MEIDLTQFHDAFYEQCAELLETLDAGLRKVDVAAPDPEALNTLFRMAHTIKGDAGTVGLHDIAAFTLHMERLLDEMRRGVRVPSDETVQVLLDSSDCVRHMIERRRAKAAPDVERINALERRLTALASEPSS